MRVVCSEPGVRKTTSGAHYVLNLPQEVTYPTPLDKVAGLRFQNMNSAMKL